MRKSVLVLAGVLAASSVVRAEGTRPPRAVESYRIVEVADGVFTFLAPEANAGFVSGNSTVVAGDGGLLVFDTGNFPSLTRRMVADLKKRTSLPVKYVVNSHWHFDHANGNWVYREAYPDALFVSTAFTREQMAAKFEKFSKGQAEPIEQDIPNLRKMLETGLKRDGKTRMTAEERAFYEGMLADEIGAAPEYRAARLVLADIAFDRSLTVYLGKREVRLMHLGRGNTGGDALAFIPDVKVLLSGDTLVLPTPFGFGSYPAEWVAVLGKIEALAPAVIVPGHGPVQKDLSYARTLSAMIETARAQMKPLVAKGMALEDAKNAVDLTAFRRQLTGDDLGRGKAFDFFWAMPFLDRVYQEAKGELAPE